MMNIEQVNELKARAERAVKLVEEIQFLRSTNRFSGILRYEEGGVRMDATMLGLIFDLGKAVLLDEKEAELNKIIREPMPVAPLQDLRIDTLDTSNEQPEPGNSWEAKAA